MRSFSDRTQKEDELAGPFIRTLNQLCQTHKIEKLGVKNTDISEIDQYIRFATDPSSRFVRFLPDPVIVRTDDNSIGPKAALIEFEVQDALIYADSLMRNIQQVYQDAKRPEDPILTEKSQIFNVEKDALNVYKQIAKLGVKVIVTGWQKPTDSLIAQYADKIVICNEWHGDRQRQTPDSGTLNYNTHIDSYEPLEAFFSAQFGIEDQVLNTITQSIREQQ